MQHAAEHRVEEGLGQFRLAMVGQQADIVEFRLLPDIVIEQVGMKLGAQPLDGLLDPVVVELDPVADALLHAGPVAFLEPGERTGRTGTKQAVMLVETVHQCLRDVAGNRIALLGDAHVRLLCPPCGACCRIMTVAGGAPPRPGLCAVSWAGTPPSCRCFPAWSGICRTAASRQHGAILHRNTAVFRRLTPGFSDTDKARARL